MIFQKKGKEMLKKRLKYLKIWAKMYKILKYFEKEQVIAWNSCMQETAMLGYALISSSQLFISQNIENIE